MVDVRCDVGDAPAAGDTLPSAPPKPKDDGVDKDDTVVRISDGDALPEVVSVAVA
jgi:hypothetical protein